MIPPCSKWHLWLGNECEGSTSVGQTTVFIRQLPEDLKLNPKALTNKGKFKRVWFCKEFTDWSTLRKVAQHFEDVCVEVTPKSYDNTPKDIIQKYRIYLKVGFVLKPGDHVSVGMPFTEETFQVGTGAKNTPDDYLKDTKLFPLDEKL